MVSEVQQQTPCRLRILVVDDHEIVREGLVTTLASRYDVVAVAADAATAMKLARTTKLDVAILDLRLPDMPGDELCRALRGAHPTLPVIIFTTYVSDETVRRALQAGASGYVTKSAGLSELFDTIERVAHDLQGPEPQEAPQIVNQLHALVARRMAAVPLTPQQESVLDLAAQGLTNQEIGARLFLSESTVRFHLQKLKAKFDARSKTDLIARAIRSGAISPAAEDATR
jgi:DNA-binding NarL/FixJ family response regulator